VRRWVGGLFRRARVSGLKGLTPGWLRAWLYLVCSMLASQEPHALLSVLARAVLPAWQAVLPVSPCCPVVSTPSPLATHANLQGPHYRMCGGPRGLEGVGSTQLGPGSLMCWQQLGGSSNGIACKLEGLQQPRYLLDAS